MQIWLVLGLFTHKTPGWGGIPSSLEKKVILHPLSEARAYKTESETVELEPQKWT